MATKKQVISIEDILADLAELGAKVPEGTGFTVRQLVSETGRSNKYVLKMLGELKREGKLENVTNYEVNLAGRVVPIPAYRIKKEK